VRSYRWPRRVAGYTASVTLSAEGREYRGRVRVVALDRVHVEGIDQRQAVTWIEHALHEQMMHLAAGGFDERDGRFTFTVDPDDLDHPRGTRVHVHGGAFTTWYRILHERICLICRELPGQWRRQTCVEVWLDLPDGRVLPQVYVITHFARDSSLAAVEVFSNQFVEVDGVWLPLARTITGAESGAMRTRSLRLADHRVSWIAGR
jgi:hypothetical protein